MTTYVLIPGAGGAASYWHRVVPLLPGRVVAPELPADDDKAGFEQYADAVLRAVGDTRGDDVVLVAQSLGGFTAPMVCAPLSARSIVLVNAMIPAPGETAGAWWANTGQDEARRACDVRAGRDPDAPFAVETYFLHDVRPEHTPADAKDQSGTPFGEVWPLDRWPDVPTRVLVGADDRFFPAEFQQRVARERLGAEARLLPGGHTIALSNPAGLAEAILDAH